MQRFTPLTLLAVLVRRTWIFAAITVGICAMFAAHAAAALVAADYLLPVPGAARPPAPVKPVRRRPPFP